MTNLRNKIIKFDFGFTLIELLVVISIIGLLSSVVLASVTTSRKRAIDTSKLQALLQIKNALYIYSVANGGFPGATYYSVSAYEGPPVLPYAWSVFQTVLGNSIILPKDPVINNGSQFYFYTNDFVPGSISSYSSDTDAGGTNPDTCAHKKLLIATVSETGKSLRQDCKFNPATLGAVYPSAIIILVD